MVSGSFSLPSRGSFHLSLTVLFSIGWLVVFRLWGWSPIFLAGFLVSYDTRVKLMCLLASSTGLLPSLVYFPKYFLCDTSIILLASLTPIKFPYSVWPPPISLAATLEIDVSFFSSTYLDVSVRWVPFLLPMYSAMDT